MSSIGFFFCQHDLFLKHCKQQYLLPQVAFLFHIYRHTYIHTYIHTYMVIDTHDTYKNFFINNSKYNIKPQEKYRI